MEKRDKIKVDFFIVGQPKSGTTALASFLSEHPQVCMSIPKEPHYFATDLRKESDQFHGRPTYFEIRTPAEYKSLYKNCRPDAIKGEASTGYLYSKSAAKNLFDHNPDAKIIIMLRNPVHFIHSLHMQYVSEATEDESDFFRAIELEDKRKQGEYIPKRTRCPSYLYYMERAKYFEQVKRYFDLFPKKNIKVLITEEFSSDNEKIYKDVVKFLGVDDIYIPEFKTVHQSKAPRFVKLNHIAHTKWIKKSVYNILGPRLYTKLQKKISVLLLKPQRRIELTSSQYEELASVFKDDVVKTQSLVRRNLLVVWNYEE